MEGSLFSGPVRTMTVIETQRMRLRRLTADDAPFMMGLMNDPAYLEHIGDRDVQTPAEMAAYITDVIGAAYEKFGYGIYLALAKDDGRPVGTAGLVNRPTLEDVDLGFAFARDYWDQGLATEAGLGVIEYAARDLGLDRLVGLVSPANGASIRVLEKLELRFEGMVCLAPDDDPVCLYGRDIVASTSPREV